MLGPRRSCRQTNVSGRDSTGLADIEPRRSGNGAVVLCLFYLRVAICLHECSSSLPPSFSSDLLFDIISSLSPPPPSLFDCRWSVPCPSFTFTWIPVNFILKVNRTSRRSLYSVDSSLSLSLLVFHLLSIVTGWDELNVERRDRIGCWPTGHRLRPIIIVTSERGEAPSRIHASSNITGRDHSWLADFASVHQRGGAHYQLQIALSHFLFSIYLFILFFF